MRKRSGSFIAGLSIGLVAGLTAGLLGVAHSTTGKKAWDRFGQMFQAGYVTGFLDCVSLAKSLDHEGYVATNFTVPPNTKPTHFQAWINTEGYTQERFANRSIPQMLVLAGNALQARFGPELPLSGTASIEAMRSVIDARRQAIREAEQSKLDLEAEKKAAAEKETGGAESKSTDAPPTDGGDPKPAAD